MLSKMSKPFLTYEEQLYNLQYKKKLIITNPCFTLQKLQDICYYSLIDGYKNLFYNPMTRIYEPNTRFEDIVALYEFDEQLRSLIFRYICHVEQKLRSHISYTFCEKYSENQSAYLTPSNYNYTAKNRKNIDKLIKILSFEANINSEHSYVLYQRNTYNNVPLWVIMNTLTLGQTSKMYSFFQSSLKSRISINYKNVSEKELEQFLKVLTHFRNICAHNERLFSFQSRYEIPNTILHSKMKIPLHGNQYIYGKHDLFAIVIAFRYLLNKKDFLSFKKELSLLINRFEKCTNSITKRKLLTAMGFPLNWSNITRYKI